MIKKHLITCSVIWVLFIITKLFIYSKSDKKETVSLTSLRNAKTTYSVATLVRYNNSANRDLNFADETLPKHNLKVKRKIRHTLKEHSFGNVQSNLLHRKAEKMFPVIEPILKEYGIPDDFKYIPLVESGFRSGTSIRGARGPWQFMPQTARDYHLRVNKRVDERLDLRKSTIAACKYLRGLYAEFNSWTLTAAAYNIGSIKLKKAIRRDNCCNYFAMHLNSETGSYVYKLVAMKEVITKPAVYGYNNAYGEIKAADTLQPADAIATLN
ncbi:lytic transglycosylase domain-containing protein [Mucilaginibacter yixingensis]|uniref:lytic transglycosylase domain-containing protein n=1 Tax=Mucilaginibacter yixingensis TaxID=1295612 RepID=UPI000D30BE7B|nr:lytic transglycosylase domain-containing protein [Mucilaginibacter yixingensis]